MFSGAFLCVFSKLFRFSEWFWEYMRETVVGVVKKLVSTFAVAKKSGWTCYQILLMISDFVSSSKLYCCVTKLKKKFLVSLSSTKEYLPNIYRIWSVLSCTWQSSPEWTIVHWRLWDSYERFNKAKWSTMTLLVVPYLGVFIVWLHGLFPCKYFPEWKKWQTETISPTLCP